MGTLDASLFVSEAVHERKVELADGEHTLYFKEVPAVEFRKLYMAEESENEDTRAGAIARLVAMSLCEPDGSPALTYKQALKLKSLPMTRIYAAIRDVNGMDIKAKNDSPSAEASGSGTPSPSPSEAEQ